MRAQMERGMPVINRTAKDVVREMANRTIILVDVREPQEHANERIEGALLFPLSTFNPDALPDPGDRKIVFHCGSGVRSARAAEACLAAGLPYDAHLEGGIQAWKAAGLPTVGGGR
jgi:rhodanese-related sulfurtransferase